MNSVRVAGGKRKPGGNGYQGAPAYIDSTSALGLGWLRTHTP